MNPFNELLGFAVLTGPLWLILLLLPLTVWVAARVSRRFAPGRTRFVAGAGIFALVFLVPFADEIAGRMYFNYLCATQAGVKVYQTVELPGEYWDEGGRPKFLKPNGDIDSVLLKDKIFEQTKMAPYSDVLGIDSRRVQVFDLSTQKLVGETISFVHWGGWINKNLNPAGASGIGCGHTRGAEFWFNFYSRLFSRSNSAGK